jgi:hypothetical protein
MEKKFDFIFARSGFLLQEKTTEKIPSVTEGIFLLFFIYPHFPHVPHLRPKLQGCRGFPVKGFTELELGFN